MSLEHLKNIWGTFEEHLKNIWGTFEVHGFSVNLLWAVNWFLYCVYIVGQDNSIGIAMCYGLDGAGIKSQWEGEIFRTCSDWPRGPPSLLYNGYWVFPVGKAAGTWHGVDHPLQSSADVKERVELYICSPSGPLWPTVWWTFMMFEFLLLSKHANNRQEYSINISYLWIVYSSRLWTVKGKRVLYLVLLLHLKFVYQYISFI